MLDVVPACVDLLEGGRSKPPYRRLLAARLDSESQVHGAPSGSRRTQKASAVVLIGVDRRRVGRDNSVPGSSRASCVQEDSTSQHFRNGSAVEWCRDKRGRRTESRSKWDKASHAYACSEVADRSLLRRGHLHELCAPTPRRSAWRQLGGERGASCRVQ